MRKLTGKGKHTVKVGNHLHTNMIGKPEIVSKAEYKWRILEMVWKLRDQQLKTISYIYGLLYQNLMGTANRKSAIDTHTKKKKQSKHNRKDSHQITREQKRKGRKKKPTKTNPKQLTKWNRIEGPEIKSHIFLKERNVK